MRPMRPMRPILPLLPMRLIATVMTLLFVGGCTGIFPAATPQATIYSLDAGRSEHTKVVPPQSLIGTLPTLIVSPVQAAAGYDSPRMLYVREDHQIEYFAHTEWVDTPARMLSSIVVEALQHSGAFRAVVLTPTAAVGDIRITIEIVRLQQHFGGGPSRVRFTMRAYLVDYATRKVFASEEFDETLTAASDSPQGGVAAANRAVQLVMTRLASFCSDAAATWQADITARLQKTQSGLPPR